MLWTWHLRFKEVRGLAQDPTASEERSQCTRPGKLQLPLPTSTQIQVGNFNQTIATLQLGGSETAIIVSIVICSVLLLLSVVGKEPFPPDAWEGGPVPPCPSPSAQRQIGEKARWAGDTSLSKGLVVGHSLTAVPWLRLTWAEGDRGWGAHRVWAVGPGCLAEELGTLSSR